MILLLVEMMNQSLGTCPNFGVHFRLPGVLEQPKSVRIHMSVRASFFTLNPFLKISYGM